VKTILLTLGDAAGIGPEVLIKCLARVSAVSEIQPIVIGELDILRDAAESLKLPVRFAPEGETSDGEVAVRSLDLLRPGDFGMGQPSALCGNAAYLYFVHAVEECLAGRAHAIVTAPLNKAAMNMAGHHFAGHTDILEKMTEVEGPVMALWHPKLVVSHVTDHLPMRQALRAITIPRVKRVVKLTWEALYRAHGKPPRIALAGINPHAGESGLFGLEEIEILRPAMAELQREGYPSSGPYPGDTVFLQGLRGRFDAVIAMYHDQGFGPMKTLDFANGVNCTLGLPFVRTSPDHGTAFEIAGKGEAEPESMIAAWELAVKLLAGP
jgi:4-phospho-D-threonate 3-dehydrogenase / 4-phospho-D-erythronate 3-dehydrogenase